METQKEIEITNSIRKKFVVSSLENISAFIFFIGFARANYHQS